MNLENKKTVLDDEASIYQRKGNLSEKEKWKSLPKGKRWEYFKNYYLMKVIVIGIIVAVVGSLVYSLLSPKPDTILSVAIMNYVLDDEKTGELQHKFEEAVALDSSKQDTLFDRGFDFRLNSYESTNRFLTYVAAKTLDVAIMPLSIFEEFAAGGYFGSVTEYLPTDIYMRLSDYLIESQIKDEEGVEKPETVYALKLDSTWLYEGETFDEPMVLGIVATAKNEDSIVELVKVLFFTEEAK